jgi:hypothetical protein
MIRPAWIHLLLSGVLAIGCTDGAAHRVRRPERADTSAAAAGIALRPSTGLWFPKYGFRIEPPAGWHTAPDSTVKRIQRSLDPRLMNEHELIAVLAPEGTVAWDGVEGIPTIRVLMNPHVNTDPRIVVEELRRSQPTLRVTMDSIADLTNFWHSDGVSDPLWDNPRHTVWTNARMTSRLGTTVYNVGALRMYRGGQISLYFNSTNREDVERAYRLLPRVLDELRIPPERDWP